MVLQVSGSLYFSFRREQDVCQAFALWTYGRVSIEFARLAATPAFASESQRVALQERLNAIPGVEIPSEQLSKYPAFPLEALRDDRALADFQRVVEWVRDEIREFESPA